MNLVHFLTHFLDQFKPGGNCMFHHVFNITKLCILHTQFIYVSHVTLTTKVTVSLHTLLFEVETEYLYSCRLTFVFKGLISTST